ncbi:hypothetical protein [Okeania sp. KiyG1]|uniref:hypothetical protein n=1 Tax=Okeania sp. KiyG1 TaxID=2720165 RepID=UPI00192076B6|nr:hypothetical protein [Okeania sp. KiyG1]GGA57904.1 hypothetical protein CYANOKiyG1_79050 [Okeania sp. KiyG1]
MWKKIHNWKSIYSLLLALLLMSGSLVACAPTESEPEPIPSEIPAPSNGKADLEKSFYDVETIHNEFQTSLDNFMNDVVAAKDGLKEREFVNSFEVNQKLTELETKVREYREQIFQTGNEGNLEQIFNDINQNIENIKPITEKLKDGLGQEPISDLQIDLKIVSNREVSYIGNLGPDTQKAINGLLTQNSEQLKDKIISLGQIVSPPSVIPDENDNELTRRIVNLERKNEELLAIVKNHQAEINNLKNLNSKLQYIPTEFNQLKTSLLILTILVVIIVLVLAGIILKPLFGESQPRRRKKLTQEGNNAGSSTGSSDTQELIFEVDDKVEDVYEKLEKMSKSWDAERKKLQNQIIDLQQNQQVKIPGNNADNRKFIFELEDKVKEISRQLQEISRWWESELRKLQSQINQRQQNQQLRTPDNVAGSYIETPRTTNYSPSPVTQEPQINPHSGSSGLQLISTYQQNPRLLSRNAIEVSETDQSIDQRRLGGGQGVILQKNRKGNYWILNEGGIDYMVPKNNIKINEYSSETVANLFECQGYRPEYSGFKLIKPAIVSSVSRGEVWQLEERGVLEFY